MGGGGAFQIRADDTEVGRGDISSAKAQSATEGPHGQYAMGIMVSGGEGEEGRSSSAGHALGYDG